MRIFSQTFRWHNLDVLLCGPNGLLGIEQPHTGTRVLPLWCPKMSIFGLRQGAVTPKTGQSRSVFDNFAKRKFCHLLKQGLIMPPWTQALDRPKQGQKLGAKTWDGCGSAVFRGWKPPKGGLHPRKLPSELGLRPCRLRYGQILVSGSIQFSLEWGFGLAKRPEQPHTRHRGPLVRSPMAQNVLCQIKCIGPSRPQPERGFRHHLWCFWVSCGLVRPILAPWAPFWAILSGQVAICCSLWGIRGPNLCGSNGFLCTGTYHRALGPARTFVLKTLSFGLPACLLVFVWLACCSK